tara:strand:+ start:27806 stop:29017 length:1212 start_codon:yes stop_codon:yes gene_type:complete
MAEKSLVEEALLEAKAIEESVKRSAKEILPSILKREINELVKESLADEEIDMETMDDMDDEMDNDMEMDLGLEMDDDMMDAPVAPIMDLDTDMDMDTDMDLGMGIDMGSPIELDLTGASDADVLKVFKKMGAEDEIEVVKTGDSISLIDGDEEYEIKNVSEGCGGEGETNYEIELDDDVEEMENIAEMEDMDDEEETIYEIELDEDEIEEGSSKTFTNGTQGTSGDRKGTSKPRAIQNKSRFKKEVNESRVSAPSRVIRENKRLKTDLSTYGVEVKKLKSKNEEYKKALSLFREKLNEVAIFNSNLAYTTKLFTEHSTTKKEKLNILSRFDEVISLKESKSLYKRLAGEISGKKPIQEAIAKKGGTKVITENISNAKNSVIRESKVYQDPQMTRMMDLMKKIK